MLMGFPISIGMFDRDAIWTINFNDRSSKKKLYPKLLSQRCNWVKPSLTFNLLFSLPLAGLTIHKGTTPPFLITTKPLLVRLVLHC